MTSANGDKRVVDLLGRPVVALIGVLAAVAALGAGYLVAALAGRPEASPYVAVGDTAIDLTPQPVKEFAIHWFGVADKTVLLVGMAVVMALLAVLAGLASRRSPVPGSLVIGVFGLVGVAAAIGRPNLGPSGALPAVVATLVGITVFRWLHWAARRPTREETAETGEQAEAEAPNRRRFLISAGTAATATAVAGLVGRLLNERWGLEASEEAMPPLVPATPAPPIPVGADFANAGTPPFLTPNPAFYRVDTALTVPSLSVRDWRLRVHGLVERELLIGFDDLVRRGLVEKTITLTCVSNEVGGPYISTANFTGVPIRDVLREAGVRPGAQQVFSTSADGFTAGTPVDVLTDPHREALLAVAMNGRPLPPEHGFPVRMVTPGLYGYVSATKWLVDMELTTFDRVAYWEAQGWAKLGPIKTESRIDRPQPFQRVPAGRVVIAGIAWAQHTGIDRVDVRLDGGPWQVARLSTEVNADTWRMWLLDTEVSPGNHTVQCRATDRSGYLQTPRGAPVFPDGATGWHTVTFTAT